MNFGREYSQIIFKSYLMNTLRNQVQLIGHLGKKPEITNLETGSKLAKFTLATNESYKNAKGDRIENTQWHNLIAWGKTAEVVELFLDKGKEIAIKGKITYNNYTDKDGNKRYTTEIVVQEVLMFGK
jgi:single-strand DNA-binding protein